MSSGLYSGQPGLSLGTGLYRTVSSLWSGASGLTMAFGGSGMTLSLDFTAQTYSSNFNSYAFQSLIDFTRTSAATYVANTGFVTQTPASRNLLTYTQEFDNAAWTKSNANAYSFDPATATYGPEVISNGDFATTASWALAATAPATATIAGGKLTLVSPAGEVASANQAVLTVGKWYKVTGDVTVRSGTVRVICGGPLEYYFTATQSFTIYAQANGNTSFSLSRQGACDADFDNISVREVIGGLITAPDGTLTGDKVVEDATNNVHRVNATYTFPSVAPHTLSVYAKAAERSWLRVNNGSDNLGAFFNLSTGVVGTTTAGVTASITAVGNGWYRCAIVFTPASAAAKSMAFNVSNADNVTSYTGDGTSGLYLWGAQLEAVPDANLVLGSERVTNGDFASGSTGWTVPAGWSIGSGVATATATNASLTSTSAVTAGKVYRVAFDVSSYTSGTLYVRVGTGSAVTVTGAGSKVVYLTATNTSGVEFYGGVVTLSLDNISVKEITGTTGMPTDYTRNNGGVYPPRFDYDPVTLAPKGLLIEEQRTNLLVRSEEFDNAAWSKQDVTVTANSTTSPDGTVDADTVIPNATNTGIHRLAVATSITAASHTFSIYAKAAGYSWLKLRLSSGTRYANFNVSTGAVGVAGAGVTSSITNVGNGWYRCAMTVTTVGSETVYISPMTTDNADVDPVSFAGDGTSGLYIWGAQLEAGAFATSYIPTVASQVTRTADVATVTGANFSRWYNQSAGSFVVEFQTLVTGAVPTTLFALTADGNTSKRFVYIGSGAEQASTFDGTTILSAAGDVTGSVAKVASAYDASARAIVSNGGAVTSGAVAAGYSTASSLNIGGGFGGNLSVGHIQSIDYYPTRLTNAQLQALTA